MNKKELLELIRDFTTSTTKISDLETEITSLTTNMQVSKPTEAVFYRLGPSDRDREAFYQRLTKANPGLIILSSGAEDFNNDNIVYVPFEKFLEVQKILLDKLFPFHGKMKFVGITGTNGKTTTSNLAMQISTLLGKPAISVGTIGIFDADGEIVQDLDATTPSYVEIRKILHQYQDKYAACFMEISSHALMQNRLNELRLDAVAWTSFSQDHLDYHKTMDEYFKAKTLIATKFSKIDGELIVPHYEKNLISELQKNYSQIKLQISKTLEARGYKTLPLFYRPEYNQSNLELAIELNEKVWGQSVQLDLNKIRTPKGRFSIVEINDSAFAIVDYAHTPDALTNIGSAVKTAFPNHKITTVFGCGGDRDRTKRPKMGQAVCEFSDKVIVTSDNPRYENPERIIKDILPGVSRDHFVITEREAAIKKAVEEVSKNEIILIAGKGHEEYQEIDGVKYPFSDFDLVNKYKK